MQKIKKTALMSAIIYIILNLVILPEEGIKAAQNAVSLCINTVIPSLFPFFIASSLFVSLGFASLLSRFFSKLMRPVFNVSGSGSLAVILGIISGYPIGASTSVRLYECGHITKTEAERLLAFTNNSGPLFVLGAIGTGMLLSPRMGAILYASHIISALLCGFIFRFYKGRKAEVLNTLMPSHEKGLSNIGSALGEAVNSAADNMLKVCGFVVFFSVVCSFIPSGRLYPYIYSLFEITGGLNILSHLDTDESLRLSLISFFLSFSGLSVMSQVSSFVIPKGLSMKPYLIGKLLQAVFSFYITKILYFRFAPYTEVSTILSPVYKNILPENLWYASLCIILFSLILLTVLLLIGFFFENKKK